MAKQGSLGKVQHLLVNTTGLWSAEQFQSRYRLRCAVAHGDTDITPVDEVELEPMIRAQHFTIENIVHGIIRQDYWSGA